MRTKIAKREKTIAEETKEFDKDRAEYNKLYLTALASKYKLSGKDLFSAIEREHEQLEKLADADSILFDYIQKRVSALHEQKSELDKKMQTMCRKRKTIDTKLLEEPMKQWDKLTVQEKHDVAAAMIDVVLISDETGIEVKFSI